MHRLFPGEPMIATEAASELGTRGIYAAERWDGFVGHRARGYRSSYGLSVLVFDSTSGEILGAGGDGLTPAEVNLVAERVR